MASQIPVTVRNPSVAGNSSAQRAKKRPSSPSVSAAPPVSSGCKRKKAPPAAPQTQHQVAADSEVRTSATGDGGLTHSSEAKPPPFKDSTFTHSAIGGAAAGKKNRTWKNLKQILALEKTLPWKLHDPSYHSIDAPPSLKPAKKYSDISGLPANYTDPQTKLRFTSSEEFSYIRLLPTDVITGYLAVRKATCVVP